MTNPARSLKTLAATLAFAALLLGMDMKPAQAEVPTQGWGYICRTTFYPGYNSAWGDGFERTYVFTGPSCTGSYIRSFYFFTHDAPNYIAPSRSYLYSEPQLLALHQSLIQAVTNGLRIYFKATTGNQAEYISFTAY